MKLDLPDGQWAELRERLTYGQAKVVKRAYVAIQQRDDDALVDLDLALLKGYVTNWDVKNIDGTPATLDAIDNVPDDVIQLIAKRAADLWNSKADPKG